MSKKFKGFSEAAKLYAQNMDLVDAMRQCFEDDITQYVEALAITVAGIVHFGSFQSSATRRYRYWWIGEAGEGYEQCAHLWFKAVPPRVLREQRMFMHAQVPAKPPERIEKIQQLVGRDSFDFLLPKKNAYAVVTADITCDEENLEVPAQQIVTLLQELHRIDSEIQQNA